MVDIYIFYILGKQCFYDVKTEHEFFHSIVVK